MPRAKVIGWTFIAFGITARFFIPFVVKPLDRFQVMDLTATFFLICAFGYGLVAFPICRQLLFTGGERTESQVDSERWGCFLMTCLGIGLVIVVLSLTVIHG